jgi:hypothetical protein
MSPNQREQFEELARQWKDETGEPEPELKRAVRRMVLDYFGFSNRAGEDLYRVIADADKIAYWARRVCLYAPDIYDEEEEEDLVEELGDENLKFILGFKEGHCQYRAQSAGGTPSRTAG